VRENGGHSRECSGRVAAQSAGDRSNTRRSGLFARCDPGVADLLLCAILRMAEGGELLASPPHLRTYMERLQTRPAFRRALALNGGIKVN
jgi:glutathione S-transferase